ncbi:rod-binding protein, partial [Thermodesulfobacteriota bacterium]
TAGYIGARMQLQPGMQTIGAITNAQPRNAVPDKGVTTPEDEKLRAKCQEFESVLFNCLLQSMRKTIDKSEIFSGGKAEELYTSMLDQEYSRLMSENARTSLGDALYLQLQSKQAQLNSKLLQYNKEL